MSATRKRSRSVVVGLALLAWLALSGIAGAPLRAASVGATLEQCQNRTTGIGDCTGSAWVTGNLNANNSLYREGDFVPFRSAITSLVAGRTYSLRIGYDAVDKGLHAYDYLGSVDGSESAPGQQVVPCYGVAGTAGPHACGNGPSTLAVPTDTDTTFPPGSHQASGEFSAWGATLKAAAYVGSTPIGVGTTGAVARQIDVTFTAAGDTVVLAWGGHIASTLDWGGGRTFISAASGSSFHMRLLQIEEIGGPVHSTGNRELSLQATALAPVPTPFTTQVDPSPVEVGSAVVDTATLGGRPGAPVSGVVNFFVCLSPTGRPDCTFGGAQVGPGQVVVAPSPTSPDGVASVQFVPDEVGSYCFRAEFVPSAAAAYSPAAHTNTTTECFDAVITPPVLTVTKICIPADDTGHFNLLNNGDVVLANAACGASTGPITTTAGTHTVSETAGTGTDLADYTSVIGGNCAADGSITLANGDSATCTITNTRNGTGIVTGTLTVNKVCSPPTAGGLFDVHIDSLLFADVPCGGSTGAVVLPSGAHTVREAGGTDTSLADYTTVIGGDCAADGSVTVVGGGAATCTITNTRNPTPSATLAVTKLCVPGSNSRFTIAIGGRPVGTVGCGGSVGPVAVTPGQHDVGETGAGGTDVSDYVVVVGGDCQADGTVFVGAGEDATCTITNSRRPRPALLAVDKLCVPSDDGGRFNLTIDGQTSASQACGERFGPLVVSPGVHHVREAAGTGTSLGDYTTVIGGDCAADGSVTVAAGQSATCTITNVRNDQNIAETTAQITISKRCRPAGVVSRFQLNLDQNVFQGVRCGASIGPILTSTGLHSVGEVAANAKPGLFRSIISGDCAPNGSITLTAGQHATCIVTNVRRRLPASLRPHEACYRLTVARRMVSAGKRVRVVAHVRLRGRGIQGVRVFAVGPGVFDVHTTDRRGRALFLLRLRRAGILRLTILKPFACKRPPPRNIGVLGASQTFLTG